MKQLLSHIKNRTRALFSDPIAVVYILLFTLSSLIFWPGDIWISNLEQLGDFESGGSFFGFGILVMWLWMWPSIPARYAKGSATGGNCQFGQTPNPTLPLGHRARSLTESILILLVISIFQAILFFSLPDWLLLPVTAFPATSEDLITHLLTGAVVVLPMLMVWNLPSKSTETYFLQPLFWAILIALSLASGFNHGYLGPFIISITVTVLVTVLSEYRIPKPEWLNFDRRAINQMHRKYRKPEKQLFFDLFGQPWSRHNWLLLSLIIIELTALILASSVGLPRMTFYLVSMAVFTLLLILIVLKPFGSNLPLGSLFGTRGTRPDHFIAAFSVLPVRRTRVVRLIFLHGLLTTTAGWISIILLNSILSFFNYGKFTFTDFDGDPALFLILPYISVAPCVAGLLSNAAVGDRKLALVSGACFALIVHGAIFLVVLDIPVIVAISILTAVALIGCLPALKYLFPEESD